jgi:hypothetical protein
VRRDGNKKSAKKKKKKKKAREELLALFIVRPRFSSALIAL